MTHVDWRTPDTEDEWLIQDLQKRHDEAHRLIVLYERLIVALRKKIEQRRELSRVRAPAEKGE